MWLNFGAVEWERAEVEVVDETLHLRRTIKALQLGVADVVSSRWRIEETVDSSSFRLRRVPEREAVGAKPDPTIRQTSLHVREEVEVVGIPNVQKLRSSGFHAN